jgi:predicted AAA+ superfamily ATPase
MNAATARKIKQMLMIISRLVPYKPSADSLASEVGVSKNNVPDYLTYLEKAGMIGLLRDDTSGMRALGKIEKAYIDNPSLMTVLAGGAPEVGNIRETFFYNQMRVTTDVIASRVADFEIDGTTFEVGGKKKTGRQIKSVENAFIVKDDLEIGAGNQIPLWTFGMTY